MKLAAKFPLLLSSRRGKRRRVPTAFRIAMVHSLHPRGCGRAVHRGKQGFVDPGRLVPVQQHDAGLLVGLAILPDGRQCAVGGSDDFPCFGRPHRQVRRRQLLPAQILSRPLAQ